MGRTDREESLGGERAVLTGHRQESWTTTRHRGPAAASFLVYTRDCLSCTTHHTNRPGSCWAPGQGEGSNTSRCRRLSAHADDRLSDACPSTDSDLQTDRGHAYLHLHTYILTYLHTDKAPFAVESDWPTKQTREAGEHAERRQGHSLSDSWPAHLTTLFLVTQVSVGRGLT